MTTNTPPPMASREGPISADMGAVTNPSNIAVLERFFREFKGGAKTSEFWLALMTMAFVAINAVFDLGVTSEQFVGLAGVAIAYAAQRGWVKTRRVTTSGAVTNRAIAEEAYAVRRQSND